MSAQQENENDHVDEVVTKKVTTKRVLNGLWKVTTLVAHATIVTLGIGAALALTRGAVLDTLDGKK